MRAMLLAAGLLVACEGGKGDASSDSGLSDSLLQIHPGVGGLGTSLQVDLSTTHSVLGFDSTSADFGAGISVDEVYVDDGWTGRAAITVEPDAELGPRDVTVESNGWVYTVTDGFEVIAESFEITPDSGKMGELVDVTVLGHNTAWVGGVTWAHFGDDIDIVDLTVLSTTLLTATLSISPDAAPGWRDVTVENGPEYVTHYSGFKVDRVALNATFDPEEAEQGDTVEFTIFGRGTDFTEDTSLTFFDTWGENPDIVVDSITVLDAENLYGQMTLSNAAALGMRDVLLTTGEEGVLVEDAFEVVAGEWDLSEVAIDLGFYVVRSKTNDTGEIAESVVASCTFYIPLDPPCPTGGGSGSGSGNLGYPDPYDINTVFGVTGEGSSTPEDCPYPTTIPAGDYVWLESDDNVITLDKVEDTSTGIVSYYAYDLTLADYVTDNWYDLHTQGEDDPAEGIGEELLERVQPTVPADWTWLSPDLWGNYTHNRAEDFDFTWTPAQTYPDARFVVTIWAYSELGPLAEEGWAGYLGVYPWDDGVHSFTAAEMSQLGAATVPVYAYSIISGPEFGLPDSIYQDNVANSYIFLAQQMILE